MPMMPFKILARVERRADAVPLLHSPGEAALVHRGHDRLLVIRCPCGCGDDVLLNLDRAAGAAWGFYQTPRGVSVFPSVWRDSGCGSHFVIWDDRVLLFGERDWFFESDESGLDEAIIAQLRSRNVPVHFKDVADQFRDVPWTVLSVCRRLVLERRAVEIRDGWFVYQER
jgi:hypothetical protein